MQSASKMTSLGTVGKYMHDNAIVGFTSDSLLNVLELMSKYYIRHLPILDEEYNIYRIVTDKDLIDLVCVLPTLKTMIMTMDKLPSQKVITISKDDDIVYAILQMTKNVISCLPVMEDNSIVGIITISDILRIDKLWAELPNTEINPYDRVLGHAITSLMKITPDHSLWQILDLLKSSEIRNLLVTDRFETITGVVSSQQVIFEIIDYHRRLRHIRKSISFEHYLFNTTLEHVMVPMPLSIEAPSHVKDIRDLLISDSPTAILVGSPEHPSGLITERDLYHYLTHNLDKLKTLRQVYST